MYRSTNTLKHTQSHTNSFVTTLGTNEWPLTCIMNMFQFFSLNKRHKKKITSKLEKPLVYEQRNVSRIQM